jgi:hypothetical protein
MRTCGGCGLLVDGIPPREPGMITTHRCPTRHDLGNKIVSHDSTYECDLCNLVRRVEKLERRTVRRK